MQHGSSLGVAGHLRSKNIGSKLAQNLVLPCDNSLHLHLRSVKVNTKEIEANISYLFSRRIETLFAFEIYFKHLSLFLDKTYL